MRGETKQKTLTKAELRAMNILWDMGQATVNEIMERIPEPKPAYTTILTVMQVLTSKKIVGAQRRGKANVFRPLISREQYVDGFMEETRNTLFKGSLKNLLLYFARKEKISKEELMEILEEMKSNEE
jgi:predicted transcriptional regulator